jgi:hypothetical protein
MQYEKRSLYASPCHTSCKLRWVAQVTRWRRPATGTRWRCLAPAKKNICQIIVSDVLLLINSTKSIGLVFCLRYVSFHFILNLQHKKSCQKKRFLIYMEPCDTPSPTIISTQRSCFGHGCVTWFDNNHEKHNYMTQLI